MILLCMFLYFICILYYSTTSSNSYVLLYHTENSLSKQYYDCIYYTRSKVQDNIQGVKYCRQLNESQPLQRDFNQSCHNNGQLWSFRELFLFNVSISDVLQWSTSMEQTDRYARYFSSSSFDVRNEYICNCTNPASFGKFCEYEFYGDSTSFDHAITKQFKPLQNISTKNDSIYVGSQLHDNRPCYTTWTCSSGLMCLDWRHICDGKQQCMDGLDEDYCEVLEFNECEDDEYRCANGMCIPEEYWLDGDYDCMDWTDEMDTIVSSGDNCYGTPSFVCDEHVCPYNQWSCGNGKCIYDGADRHEGTRHNFDHFCENMRDVNYMCEAVTRYSKSWWTIERGYCLPYSLSYQTLGLDTTAIKNKCAFSIKCALSNNLDQDCKHENNTVYYQATQDLCNDPYMFYPESDPLLLPYFYMLYARKRDWTNKKPDKLLYEGQIKCVGYQVITKGGRRYTLSETFKYYDYRVSENRLCTMREDIQAARNYSGPHYDMNCWNHSKTYSNRLYQVSSWCETRCISKYRIRDGVTDCHHSEELKIINNSCPQIQHHRLQCSSSEPACLLAAELGNWGSSCSNRRDEIDHETGTVFKGNVDCKKRIDPWCAYLRNYIRTSSYNITTEAIIADNPLLDDRTTAIPFRSYCNSFFNTKSGIDELPEFCHEWICFDNEYQCLSGQCILQDWICDGEWDCNDASDEERLFIIDHLSEHNSRLKNLTELKQQCYEQYSLNNTPFSNICDVSFEYPCFRTGIDDPLNVELNRPCINLTQIGDEKIDCLSGLDERNTLQCSRKGMLGFHFQFDDTLCVSYNWLCTTRYPWKPNANVAYDTVCFHQRRQYKNGTSSKCNSLDDVMCLNDVCQKNARCNGEIECLHGEDEYRCVSEGISTSSYREQKTIIPFEILRIPDYSYPYNGTDLLLNPGERKSILELKTKIASVSNINTVYEKRNATVKSVYEIVHDSLPNSTITFEGHYLPFICNRGVAVRYYTGHTVCFCPPSFYGSQCEFYSDRITVLTHLDLTNYAPTVHRMTVVKVLATFLFENRIIDFHEFHVNPQIQNTNNYVKQNIYFLYPRTKIFIDMKVNNRSGTKLFGIRFEAFNLYLNGKIEPIGVWHYPIYFDFLPVFSLSKILRFHSRASTVHGPCLNSSCGKTGMCQEVLNSNHSLYFCSCDSGYYGAYCEHFDEKCVNYCSPKSVCKPEYREVIIGSQHPLCLCAASTFGSSCYVKNDNCQKDPCLNGGSCMVTYDMTDTNNYTCLCTELFRGDHCQFPKGTVNITFIHTSQSTLRASDVVATTVSYNDYDLKSFHFLPRYQQVYNGLPSDLQLIYSDELIAYAPITAILKVYGLNYRVMGPEYYILYFHPKQKEINTRVDLTAENHCSLVQNLQYLVRTSKTPRYSNISMLNSTATVFFYHRICQAKRNTNVKFTCFHDQNYLCICDVDHYRAECFGYSPSIDQCSLCLSNGYCLRGGLTDKNDFVCLCPHCHFGKLCQFSNELMSFTLDSLIVKDIQNKRQASTGIYISIAAVILLFGLLNNISSFLTFVRPKSRKVITGSYLLIISIVDQCSLLLLFLKIIHIILGSNGSLFYYENGNLYSCKIVSYLLSVFTRITYWLTSFVTITRLCLVLFPTSDTLKNSRRIFILNIFVMLLLFVMHTHEIIYYTTIVDPLYTSVNVTLCITSYVQSSVSTYNRVNILIHYFIPFFIQIISITILLVKIAFSRARTNRNNQQTFVSLFMEQLRKQKEQYIAPIIIVLSSLPQIILSFSYACRELTQSWQRYTLLTTYFLSYLPQMLSFVLYVLPSTTYSEEFRQTIMGKTLSRQQNIEIKTRTIKQNVASSLIETRK